MNIIGWDNHLGNSQRWTQADAGPQAWTHNEVAGGLPWGPAVAGGSHGCLAVDGTSLHYAMGEEQADDTPLSKGLGWGPVTVLWAFPVAVVAAGEPKVPSLTL